MTLKPLPDVDLLDRYSHEYANFSQRERPRFTYCSDILRGLEHEENPVILKSDILDLAQLLFEGIVLRPERGSCDGKKACLDALYDAGKRCIGSFYRGEPEPPDTLRELLLPQATAIISYAKDTPPKNRHLRWDYTLQLFGRSLPKLFPGLSGIEVLVGIASGGFEPSFLLMDMLDCPLLPVAYSHVHGTDTTPHLPKLQKGPYLSALHGKQVLLVDDVVYSGKALWKVSCEVASAQPRALYGCAVAGLSEQIVYDKKEALKRLVPSLRPGVLQVGQHFLCSFSPLTRRKHFQYRLSRLFSPLSRNR